MENEVSTNDSAENEKFCQTCGSKIHKDAEICPKCGVRQMVQPAAGSAGCERLVYILLAVFTGTIGIHNFYAGYTGKGVAQLLITLLSCGIGALGVFIWNIVEIVTVKQDAQGRPFK